MSGAPDVMRVCVTGAAGQIAYSLLPLLASGAVFGPDQKVALHLLDIKPAMKMLGGVVMELEDGAYPLLDAVVATDDLETAFSGIHLAILVGAMPRREGMERSDLLKANAGIFKAQGAALNEYADPEVRVLVVGNPANTNCGIAMACAPKIPKHHFSALTRLDQHRATAMVAQECGMAVGSVGGVVIWGNHSSTQYPSLSLARAGGSPPALPNPAWRTETFEPAVQRRGAAVIAARGLSSAMSAANAIGGHVRDWWLGRAPDPVNHTHVLSMAVPSPPAHGIAEGLVFSFPVVCRGKWQVEIVKGDGTDGLTLDLDAHARAMIAATEAELVAERDTAHAFLA
eukprot:TRINITY_DN344_c1_g1_i1.p1 TRINITY_DN344_c1_g1~~TRINITY_DN344_c1_g1_i1.p1  ORF type:complete len:342 (-),score=83.90 TRINITY_DN344_c1_g1_i1:219-1244(-)